jgi:hypothetical protein
MQAALTERLLMRYLPLRGKDVFLRLWVQVAKLLGPGHGLVAQVPDDEAALHVRLVDAAGALQFAVK